MAKYFRALNIVILLFCFLRASANNNGNVVLPNNNNTFNQQRGSITNIINRIPRNYDTQTLLNTGPGLLQEAYFLFRRFGDNKNQNKDKDTQVQKTEPDENSKTTTNQEQIINEPVVQEPFVQQTFGPISQPEEIDPSVSTPESLTIPDSKTLSPKQIMLPAPAPGFIIRYNQEKGVYEEVREIPITIPE